MFESPSYATVTIFAGSFAPSGWAICNGQIMAISQDTALFALLGTTYGGDGQQTFALPDLRGRVAVHEGQGLTLGEIGGAETVTLLTTQLPVHGHTFISASGTPAVSNMPGNSADPSNKVPAAFGTNTYNSSGGSDKTGPSNMSVITTGVAGSSQAIATLSPYLAMNYIICISGLFPTRN